MPRHSLSTRPSPWILGSGAWVSDAASGKRLEFKCEVGRRCCSREECLPRLLLVAERPGARRPRGLRANPSMPARARPSHSTSISFPLPRGKVASPQRLEPSPPPLPLRVEPLAGEVLRSASTSTSRQPWHPSSPRLRRRSQTWQTPLGTRPRPWRLSRSRRPQRPQSPQLHPLRLLYRLHRLHGPGRHRE